MVVDFESLPDGVVAVIVIMFAPAIKLTGIDTCLVAML